MRRLVLVTDGGPVTDERQFPLGSRVDNLDVSGVHLHGANLAGAKLTDAYLCGADISGDIEGLRVNEVEIEPLVQAELDRRRRVRRRLCLTLAGGCADLEPVHGRVVTLLGVQELLAARTRG
jgi:uncharacterized protein YjbI with pentapeptide repeats